jgi:hypothetical protein
MIIQLAAAFMGVLALGAVRVAWGTVKKDRWGN